MKPNIAHAMINGEPRFAVAHRVLHRDLHQTGPEQPRVTSARMHRMRTALSLKLRQALLLAAFKEEEHGDDEPLEELGARAQALLQNPSWTSSVADYVYRSYGVQDAPEMHPPLDVVERETLSSAHKIAKVLGVRWRKN